MERINEDKTYPVKIVFNDEQQEVTVNNIRAINGMDIDVVAKEIATGDIMATAVGVNVLSKIIKPICAGLRKRFDKNGSPLNMIICENLIDPDR